MADIDYGKASRDDFKEKNPGKEAEDAAYLKGEAQPDPVGLTEDQLKRLRRNFGERGSRYIRPAQGYKGGDHHLGPVVPAPGAPGPKIDPMTEEIISGGVYRKDTAVPPLTDAQRCENLYRWVEDVFLAQGSQTRLP